MDAAPEKRKRRFSWGNQVPDARHPKLANLVDEQFLRATFADAKAAVFPGYDDGFAFVSPVKTFAADCSPVGAFDMTGNLREMCRDHYDPHYYATFGDQVPTDPVNDRDAPGEEGVFVERGGSWGDHKASLGAWTRFRTPPNRPRDIVGFRIVVPAK
jgi:formylglycine-generating enzyme required for sulfatase activity